MLFLYIPVSKNFSACKIYFMTYFCCLSGVAMCMEMGTIGIPWVPWDSHGNGGDNDYITGMRKYGNRYRAVGMGM